MLELFHNSRDAYVLRDSWTKHNVAPAKMIQVCSENITGLLYAYMCTDIVIYIMICVDTLIVMFL